MIPYLPSIHPSTPARPFEPSGGGVAAAKAGMWSLDRLHCYRTSADRPAGRTATGAQRANRVSQENRKAAESESAVVAGYSAATAAATAAANAGIIRQTAIACQQQTCDGGGGGGGGALLIGSALEP